MPHSRGLLCSLWMILFVFQVACGRNMKVSKEITIFSESDWLQPTLNVLRLPLSNGRNVITLSASGSGGNISATKIHVIAPSISRYLEKPLSRYDDHNRASASFQRAFEMPVFFVSAPRFSCSESQPKSKTGARWPIRQQHGSIRTEHVRIR